MPAKSFVLRAGWIARLVSVFLVAGCVGEIGESAPGPSSGSGTGGHAGSVVATGIGGGNDSTGASGAAGTGSDPSGSGGAGASAGDGGGATGGGGNDTTGSGGIGGTTGTAGTGTGGSGTGGRGGSSVAGTTGRGGAGGTAGRGGTGGGAGTTGRGGTTGGGGTGGDPFTVAPKCTSGTMWTQANRGSSDMNPGKACIACHSTMNGPSLTIGGTVYPSAHEPDLCNGAPGSNGARIVITGADGATLTLTPGTSGNFNSRTKVTLPFKAKVTYMGRERAMVATQVSGDCNSCHTQNGTNSAPGRILLP
jgi:hypothetical protein